MTNPWTSEGDPVAGTRVESWTHTHEDGDSAWLQVVGRIHYDADGDPYFAFADIEHTQFHALPPTGTDTNRVWRYL